MAVVLDARAAVSWLTASQATPASEAFFSGCPELPAPFVFPIEGRRKGAGPKGG